MILHIPLGKGRPKNVAFGHDVERTLGPFECFRTSFNVEESNSYIRLGRGVGATYILDPRKTRTSRKLSYGPKVGLPLNDRGRLAQ